ncbi:kinase-like domain-containing protein [Fimicolochytrium jonesii]|uniref:kinase-like domain-containing protein n=1 Tax=Fimicolochytrium jonesii TaxID=1396493 RepID=UPI0022FDF024|nr:kinase-like domain-containing protein [Fimicolochytrium jonesii]KAI8818198.1 kinase-like domain-containing protein [Fimicolochytrium jonesii]
MVKEGMTDLTDPTATPSRQSSAATDAIDRMSSIATSGSIVGDSTSQDVNGFFPASPAPLTPQMSTLSGDTKQSLTQPMSQRAEPESVETEEDNRVWAVLQTLNPDDHPTVKLRRKSASDAKSQEGGRSANAATGYVIGRHRECDVRVANPVVSNRHCVIFQETVWNDDKNWNEEVTFIEDLSSNGTWVNDKKLQKGRQHRLHTGDKIQFAHEKFYSLHLPKPSNANSGGIHKKYHFGKELGTGNFATVKLATDRETGEKVAIKCIAKSLIQFKPKFLENLKQEISILMGLDHPNVISILGAFWEEEFVYIVLELVRGGELFDAIIARQKFSEDMTREMMRQLFEALKYLHERDISHRDLKPENILLADPFTESTEHITIKISDFGLAKLASETSFMGTLCGTPNYVAPEVLDMRKNGRKYTKAVDLWSCGVVLYICLCGFPPFSEELAPPPMADQIRQGKYEFRSPWWDKISRDAIDLIKGLLTVDPSKRLTVHQALDHPWIRNHAPPLSPVSRPSFRRGDTVVTPNRKRKAVKEEEDVMAGEKRPRTRSVKDEKEEEVKVEVKRDEDAKRAEVKEETVVKRENNAAGKPADLHSSPSGPLVGTSQDTVPSPRTKLEPPTSPSSSSPENVKPHPQTTPPKRTTRATTNHHPTTNRPKTPDLDLAYTPTRRSARQASRKDPEHEDTASAANTPSRRRSSAATKSREKTPEIGVNRKVATTPRRTSGAAAADSARKKTEEKGRRRERTPEMNEGNEATVLTRSGRKVKKPRPDPV